MIINQAAFRESTYKSYRYPLFLVEEQSYSLLPPGRGFSADRFYGKFTMDTVAMLQANILSLFTIHVEWRKAKPEIQNSVILHSVIFGGEFRCKYICNKLSVENFCL